MDSYRNNSTNTNKIWRYYLYILCGLILFPSICNAAPPSRLNTYVAGNTILAADVTGNEDAIFNYLQAGVDTYAPLSIDNADISLSANIQSDKLNLASIAQDVGITSAGSFDNNGTTSLDGVVTVSAAANFDGAVDFDSTIDFSGATITAAFTVADITATTADINGGTIDGVTLGDTSSVSGTFTTIHLAEQSSAPPTAANEGAIYTKDVSGTTKLFYRENSNGNETQIGSGNIEIFTADGTWTAPTNINYVLVTMCGGGGGGGGSNGALGGGGGGGGGSIVEQVIKVTPSSTYTVTVGNGGSGGAAGGDNAGSAGTASTFVTDDHTISASGGSGGAGGSTGTGGAGGTGNTDLSGGTPTAGASTSYVFAGGAGANQDSDNGGGGGGAMIYGVGANGGANGAANNGSNAPANSCGGGGGGSGSGSGGGGGNGADGIIIIKYNENGTPS